MKQTMIISLLLCMAMVSCQHNVQTPLQIPYAESVVESHADATFALYLLSEVEDTIPLFPDSVRMRYRLAEAMALNAKGKAVDSLLPPLMEWFDTHGPTLETARVHHLKALTLLQHDAMDEARNELHHALSTEPSYLPSRFMTAYLCLYIGEYAEAMEHFMHIKRYEGQRGSIMQGAWALHRYMGDGTSNFAQALQGEELETTRRMLTDMDFSLRYFREHPDSDQADIVYRCVLVRDSLLWSSLTPMDSPQPLSSERPGVKLRGGRSWYLYIIIAAGLLVVGKISFRKRRRRESEPRSTVFVEIVQEMEQLADGGGQPSAEQWEQLRCLVQERHPRLMKELQQMDLSRSELQMCMLSAIDLRQKQVATLLDISPQNLRNQRLRLLARITGRQTDSVADFTEWIEGMKFPSPLERL